MTHRIRVPKSWRGHAAAAQQQMRSHHARLHCSAMLAEAAQIQSPVREVLLAALSTSASLLLAAVLRALASPFGIGRVHKAACALCHLHMLAAAQQSPQQASAWLQSLLGAVAGSLQQEGYVEQDVAQRL